MPALAPRPGPALAAAALLTVLFQASCRSPGLGDPLPYRLDRPEQVVIGGGQWTGPEDCSGQAGIAWTEQALIVTVEVRDDTLVGSTGDPWEGDSIEIYLDLRPEVERDGAYAPGVLQAVVVPGLAADGQPTISFHAGEGANYDPDVRDVDLASVPTADGYRVTVAFPLAELTRAHLRPGPTLAFDLGINDADKAGRESQLMLFGTADNWTSTLGFQSLTP